MIKPSSLQFLKFTDYGRLYHDPTIRKPPIAVFDHALVITSDPMCGYVLDPRDPTLGCKPILVPPSKKTRKKPAGPSLF